LSKPLPGTSQKFLRVLPGQHISVPLRDGINYDREIWGDDAETFRPERWLSEPLKTGPGPGGLLTFGDGYDYIYYLLS
jgi:cytochrome P450